LRKRRREVEVSKNIPLPPSKGESDVENLWKRRRGVVISKNIPLTPFKGGIMGETSCYFAIRKFVEISKNIP
jgi:hypothetical protein